MAQVKILGAGVLSLSLLIACSQMKQLSDMHDSTNDMADTTKSMKASTQSMEKLTQALSLKTEELKEMTAQLYIDAKQGTAMGLREDILKKIMNSTSQVEKLSKTAKYFMAFEYQIWSGVGPDTEATREDTAASAAREFMREVQRFVSDSAKQNGVIAISSPEAIEKVKTKIEVEATEKVTKIAKHRADELEAALKSNEKNMKPDEIERAKKEIADARLVHQEDIEKAKKEHDYNIMLPMLKEGSNINAFSVAMHIQNPIQEALLKANPNLKSLSMYNMIKEAFLADKEIEAGRKKPADFPQYTSEIRSFLDVAAVLVKSRSNALAAMALTKVSPLLSSDDPLGLLTNMASAKWNIETKNLNSKAIRDASTFLDGAIKTRDFMKEAGIAEDETGSTRPVFAQGQASDEMLAARQAVAAAKTSGVDIGERTAALAELADMIEAYIK
jgi:hypothetical protein